MARAVTSTPPRFTSKRVGAACSVALINFGLASVLAVAEAAAPADSVHRRPEASVSPVTSPALARVPAGRLVDINRASRARLKTLPGIGDAEADRIVAARPYLSKTQLVEKQVLTLEAFEQIRRHIAADQRRGRGGSSS